MFLIRESRSYYISLGPRGRGICPRLGALFSLIRARKTAVQKRTSGSPRWPHKVRAASRVGETLGKIVFASALGFCREEEPLRILVCGLEKNFNSNSWKIRDDEPELPLSDTWEPSDEMTVERSFTQEKLYIRNSQIAGWLRLKSPPVYCPSNTALDPRGREWYVQPTRSAHDRNYLGQNSKAFTKD